MNAENRPGGDREHQHEPHGAHMQQIAEQAIERYGSLLRRLAEE